MQSNPSGRFVLRLPPELHSSARNKAREEGISLNEYCTRAIRACVSQQSTEEGKYAGTSGQDAWIRHLDELLHGALAGVLLFGSAARGERGERSDIDLLIILQRELPLVRQLYRLWDEEFGNDRLSAHFVHLPANIEEAGSLWFEVAMDGITLFEKDREVSRFLGKVRRAVAGGSLTRSMAYGQPYWIRAEEEPEHA